MKNKLLLIIIAIAVSGATYTLLPKTEQVKQAYQPRTENHSVNANDWKGAAEYYKMLRMDPNTGEVPVEAIIKAQQQVNEMAAKTASVGLTWVEKGPDNVGGRTRAVLVDRTDETGNTLWAGSVSGGLFKSEDAAGTWTRASGFNVNNSIGSIAQAPNGDLYVGTGSTFDNSSGSGGSGFIGQGMFKSTDGGTTWSAISSTVPTTLNNNGMDWIEINRIKVDPSNSNKIYTCMNKGLRVSTDGGSSWTNPVYIDGPPSCNLIAQGTGDDVEITDDGVILVAISGQIYRSTTGNDCTFDKITSVPNVSRIDITVSPADNNYVYAVAISGGTLEGVYKSTNKGVTFTKILQQIPNYFQPMVSLSGQGYYDLFLQASPVNPDEVILGGVQLWRWNGNLTRIAAEFGFYPTYVHSDKHYLEYDPFDPTGKTVYCATDGGISKSFDGGNTWVDANRGYVTTQFYSIAFYNRDKMASANILGGPFGGLQDNGTQWVPGVIDPQMLTNSEKDAVRILGGDGFDVDASQILPSVTFSSLYFADIRRNGAAIYCNPCPQNGPFYSRLRLWETLNDPTSKDSILFINKDTNRIISTGDGIKKTFTGTLTPNQTVGIFVNSSIYFKSGTDTLEDFNGDGILTGAGTGTFNYTSGAYVLTFATAPSLNTSVFANWQESYSSGDVIYLSSNTGSLPIEYTLQANNNPGDTILIQDPVQSILVNRGTSNGTWMTRNALKLNKPADNLEWWNIPGASGANCFEFSSDGNHLFVGTGSSVVRVSGLNNVYDSTAAFNLSPLNIKSFGQVVTGISVHPTNPEIILVSLGNYGKTNNVSMITNAISTMSNNGATAIPKQGDLPAMPCYDVAIDVTDPNIVVLGTEYGVWATSDITASSVSWTNESGAIGNTPIFAVRQQRQPYNIAKNHEVYYLGTHGRGMWKSESLVGIDRSNLSGVKDKFITDLIVYPNPMVNEGYLSFNFQESATAEIKVYDLNGRLVKSISKAQYGSGVNNVKFNINNLSSGTYFVTLETDRQSKVAKFIVNK
jgi:type IX secretion system substrate protein